MDKKTDNLIKAFINSAAMEYPLKKVFLFGSYAKKSNITSSSDIDIALIIDNLNDDDKFDAQIKLFLIAAKFDSRIEPHPLSNQDFNINNPFASEIQKTGIEIKF
jgi:predicted nucleotidyltransferase